MPGYLNKPWKRNFHWLFAAAVFVKCMVAQIPAPKESACDSLVCPHCSQCQLAQFTRVAKCMPRLEERCCPSRRFPVQCTVDPFAFTKCANFPSARCVPDFCGSCAPRFFNPTTNTDITGRCGDALPNLIAGGTLCERAKCPLCTFCIEISTRINCPIGMDHCRTTKCERLATRACQECGLDCPECFRCAPTTSGPQCIFDETFNCPCTLMCAGVCERCSNDGKQQRCIRDQRIPGC